MGVSILRGEADGTNHGAVMYDNTSGWPVGPIWEGQDAIEQVYAFLEWVTTGRWAAHKQKILAADPHMTFKVVLGGDDDDIRSYSHRALVVMIEKWKSLYLTDDGWLFDYEECVCGEAHHHDADGCLTCDCTTFVGANPAAVDWHRG